MGIEGERIWTAASGFGGGIARQQYVCGALTGATIALGLYGGETIQDPKVVADTIRPKVEELVDGFTSSFGNAKCHHLVPFDFKVPGEYELFRKSGVKQQKCHQYVKHAVETVSKWKAEGSLV